MSFLITEIVGVNSAINILCALAGVIMGGILAWVIAAKGVIRKWELKLEETERRASTAEGKMIGLESTVAELRTQPQRASEGLENIRSKPETDRTPEVSFGQSAGATEGNGQPGHGPAQAAGTGSLGRDDLAPGGGIIRNVALL